MISQLDCLFSNGVSLYSDLSFKSLSNSLFSFFFSTFYFVISLLFCFIFYFLLYENNVSYKSIFQSVRSRFDIFCAQIFRKTFKNSFHVVVKLSNALKRKQLSETNSDTFVKNHNLCI